MCMYHSSTLSRCRHVEEGDSVTGAAFKDHCSREARVTTNLIQAQSLQISLGIKANVLALWAWGFLLVVVFVEAQRA